MARPGLRLLLLALFTLCFLYSLVTLTARVEDLEEGEGAGAGRLGRLRTRLGLGVGVATDAALVVEDDGAGPAAGAPEEAPVREDGTLLTDAEGVDADEIDRDAAGADGEADAATADPDADAEADEWDDLRPKPKPFDVFAAELLNATVPIVMTRRSLRSREWFTCGGTHVVKFKRYGELKTVNHLSDVLPQSDPFVVDERGKRKRNVDSFGRAHAFDTCAVVGNSGSLLETQFGSDIDSNEVVIRFNSAVTEGYEQFVGYKTTFRIVNSVDNRFTNAPPGSPSAPSPDETTIFTVRSWDVIREYSKISFQRSMELGPYVMADPEFLCHVWDWVHRRGEKPSSGLVGIILALRSCRLVRAYGFQYNNYFKKNARPHYYDWERPKKGREKVHPFRGEVTLYKDLAHEGLISFHGPGRRRRRHR